MSIPIPKDLDLPFPSWRSWQERIITKIAASPKKYILLDAPPGIGKTAIAVGAARIGGWTSRYLTGTKQLQAQYSELPNVMKVVGRGNFPCLIQMAVTAAQGICTRGGRCDYKGVQGRPGCGYYDQKRAGIEADEITTNYAYALRALGDFPSTDLLVCDEAHTIRGHLEQFVGAEFSERDLEVASVLAHRSGRELDPEPNSSNLNEWRGWAKADLDQFRDVVSEGSDWDHGTQEAAGRVLAGMRALATQSKVVMQKLGEKWRVTPVWVQGLFEPSLGHHAERTLFMSATILDPQLFCDILGLDRDEVDYIPCGSPFPAWRRPIRYMPTSKVVKGGSLDEIVGTIDRILDAHPGEKGLIHTVSYQLTQAVLGKSRRRHRLVGHRVSDREDVLEAFKRTSSDSVLVSPSMGVGVDLPYDECRFQIVAKLPFPDRSDPQRVAQGLEPLGKKLAIYDTACALIQSYGRAMRADDDWGVTYLLDSNFSWFQHAAKAYLPKWFTEAIDKSGQLGPLF